MPGFSRVVEIRLAVVDRLDDRRQVLSAAGEARRDSHLVGVAVVVVVAQQRRPPALGLERGRCQRHGRGVCLRRGRARPEEYDFALAGFRLDVSAEEDLTLRVVGARAGAQVHLVAGAERPHVIPILANCHITACAAGDLGERGPASPSPRRAPPAGAGAGSRAGRGRQCRSASATGRAKYFAFSFSSTPLQLP